MYKKPNLFIVGTQKSGTTSLYYYLSQHPYIYLPTEKEPRFFNYRYDNKVHKGPGDEVWDKSRITNLKDYLQLYDNVQDEKIIGDATIEYLYYPEVASDIKRFNKDAKIIIVLRNPIERAFSAYTHVRRDLRETLSFPEALKEEEKRIQLNYHQIWHYKSVGKYYKQIKSYLDVFGRDNVHIVLQEDLNNKTNQTMKEIFDFLSIEYFNVNTHKKYNISGIPKNIFIQSLFYSKIIRKTFKHFVPDKYRKKVIDKVVSMNLKKTTMDLETRKYLIEYFKEDILLTQLLINKSLDGWLQLEK